MTSNARFKALTQKAPSSIAHLLLGLYAQRGMGNQTQALFADQPTRNTANAIGLVTNAQQSILQVLDEFLLTACQLRGFFAAQRLTTVLDHLHDDHDDAIQWHPVWK